MSPVRSTGMEKSPRGAGSSLGGDHRRTILSRSAEGDPSSDPDADRSSLGGDRRILPRHGAGADAALSSGSKAAPTSGTKARPHLSGGAHQRARNAPVATAVASFSSGSKAAPTSDTKARPHLSGGAHQRERHAPVATAVASLSSGSKAASASGHKARPHVPGGALANSSPGSEAPSTSDPKSRPHLRGGAHQRPTVAQSGPAATVATSPDSQHRLKQLAEARLAKSGLVSEVTQREPKHNSRASREPNPCASILIENARVTAVQVAARSRNSDNKYFQIKPVGDQVGQCFKLPREVYEPLFVYQKEALHWFWSLYCKKTGGLLADDMGLGKTREVLSFLFGLFHSKLIKRAMIMVPVSVVHRWLDEQGGLLITTYQALLPHIGVILGGNRSWDYIIFDEGHRLKNSDAQITKAVQSAKCHHKIVVTGTPVQNCLKEFYNLVNLCVPNLLGSYQNFQDRFVFPMEKGKHSDATEKQKQLSLKVSEKMNAIVAPYMLRRTKEILKGVLSNKEEVVVWLRLNPLQERLYVSLLAASDWSVKGAPLAVALIARYICNHPLILHESLAGEYKNKSGLAKDYMLNLVQSVPFEKDINLSCKIIFTLDLVRELLKKGHKILIFSQSCPMLKILERALSNVLGLDKSKMVRMDGKTKVKDREAMIDAFQGKELKKGGKCMKKKSTEDPMYKDPSVFLLTTFVGGVGLELTKATRVIIIDPNKNPSNDSQSVDRAFRVGQDQEVIVYRLITCGTIEEHGYRQQVLKGEMSVAITENEQCERNIESQKQNVLSLPKKGFAVPITHQDLLERHGDFWLNIPEDIGYVRNHESVLGVNNHAVLFSRKERLPLECDAQSSEADAVYKYSNKKSSRDTASGWEDHAFAPSHSKWRAPVAGVSVAEGHKQLYQNKPTVVVKGRQVKARGPGECSRPDKGHDPSHKFDPGKDLG